MPELTTAAELAWQIAALEAQRGRAAAITSDHLAVGVLSLEKLLEPSAGLTPERRADVRSEQAALTGALAVAGLDAAALRRGIRARIMPGGARTTGSPQRDAACRAVFERAAVLAHTRGGHQCGVVHLVAALLEQPTPTMLAGLPRGVAGSTTLERLRAAVERAIATGPVEPRTEPATGREGAVAGAAGVTLGPAGGASARVPSQRDVAATYDGLANGGASGVRTANDAGAVSPVTPLPHGKADPDATQPRGRDLSAEPVTRPQAFPEILRQHGRDLTAEAEAGSLGPVIGRHDEMLQVVRVLRRRTKNSPVLIGEAGVGKTAIVEGLAQLIAQGAVLPGRRIVALNLASVVAGTSYRGQFEERFEEILSALRERPEIILFLDELHTIVGAGDTDGRLDAANILKPALARGEIGCIGATTIDEYRRHIERDAALERRFQPVLVQEPSPAETRVILDGLRADLERHHDVSIAPEALDAAVALTVRYVQARRLPDKAVDALDEACARAGVPSLTRLPTPGGDAAGLVTRETVAQVVSVWTGLPLGRIEQAEADSLVGLEARLVQRVIGQPEAIGQVAQRIRMARTGLVAPNRPVGVFLFLGPSGVGKTALAQALAETLFESPDAQPDRDRPPGLIRLDMSEYGEKHHTARLVGAPPGYVGYEGEGQLTGPLRHNPRAVVLLDEVEKAHPEVFDLFLQLFDAGRLTDGHGRLVDGCGAIFVLTSNLQPDGAGRRALGFGHAQSRQRVPPTADRAAAETAEARDTEAARLAEREALATGLRSFFRPELLNRIDEIVLFRALGETELVEIARRLVSAIRARLLEQQGVALDVAAEVFSTMARGALAGSGGARDVQRILARLIEGPLSRDLLSGKVARGDRLAAEIRDGIVTIVHTGHEPAP